MADAFLAVVRGAGMVGITGKKTLLTMVKGKATTKNQTVDFLVEAGFLDCVVVGKASRYTITERGIKGLESGPE